ncbi:MAG: Zn-dependent hydrolase [Pseudonocardiales bacterium]|nr:MAG: Zn-dependent hydrolase [Pseudonocardiales bacterium]
MTGASAYDGHVDPHGAIAVRTLPALQISKRSVGPMDNNAYLLRCISTGDALLIDAASDADALLDMVGSTPLRYVLTTHQHGDHWQALEDVVGATDALTIAHPKDAAGLPVATATTVEDGDTITLGGVTLSVIHLRGHTPGSIAIRYDDPRGHPHLFTGDSLFPGGPGKTAGVEQFTSLLDDLQARVFDVLPDDTWVYPGHGDDTTLGAERPHLAEWRARGW